MSDQFIHVLPSVLYLTLFLCFAAGVIIGTYLTEPEALAAIKSFKENRDG